MVSMAPPPSSHVASGAEYSVTGDVTATEQDNDRKLVTSPSSVIVVEGSSATYTVRLATRPTGTVTVAVSFLQGDAGLSVTPASLFFTTGNWNTPHTVTVRAAQDNDLADGSATFWHSASEGGYGGVTASITASEDDDDTAQFLFSATSVTVPEDGTATYTVRPRYAPTGTVSVSLAVGDGDPDITVSPPTLHLHDHDLECPSDRHRLRPRRRRCCQRQPANQSHGCGSRIRRP